MTINCQNGFECCLNLVVHLFNALQCSVHFSQCTVLTLHSSQPMVQSTAAWQGTTNIGEFITMISLSHTIMTPPLLFTIPIQGPDWKEKGQVGTKME